MKKTDLLSKIELITLIVAKFAKNGHVSGNTIEKHALFSNASRAIITKLWRKKVKENDKIILFRHVFIDKTEKNVVFLTI